MRQDLLAGLLRLVNVQSAVSNSLRDWFARSLHKVYDLQACGRSEQRSQRCGAMFSGSQHLTNKQRNRVCKLTDRIARPGQRAKVHNAGREIDVYLVPILAHDLCPLLVARSHILANTDMSSCFLADKRLESER